MKIQRIQNFTYNTHFNGAATPNYHINDISGNNSENKTPDNQIPEWARKGMLALLIFFAVKNDPSVQNLMKPESIKREEKARTEYFEDVHKLGNENKIYPAVYHLNRLADVDNIGIKSNGRETYTLNLKLDSINADILITLSSVADNTLSGTIKIKNGENARFKAIFSDKKPDEFELQIRNPNNEKFTLGRTAKGEFYQVKNNKKVVLNKKNVEKYQKSLENIPNYEDMENISFFTTKNDMWRKLNLILLSFLLLAEMNHDNNKRREKQKD